MDTLAHLSPAPAPALAFELEFADMVGFLVVRASHTSEEGVVEVSCYNGDLSNPASDVLILVQRPVNFDMDIQLILWRDRFWQSPDWSKLYSIVAETVGKFSKFAIPLIKRAYPALIAGNLVGVQPLQRPASLMYYLHYKYAQAKNTSPGTTP